MPLLEKKPREIFAVRKRGKREAVRSGREKERKKRRGDQTPSPDREEARKEKDINTDQ
jgi:hypothetical protein